MPYRLKHHLPLTPCGRSAFWGSDEIRRKAAVEFVLKGLESGALKPVIDRTLRFDDIVDVHRYLEKNGQFGKIVVTV